MTRRAAMLAAGMLAVLPFVLAAAARAHSAGLSRGEYRFDDEGTLSVTMVFARVEVSDVVPTLDGNLDGFVTPDEVAAARPAVRAAMLDGMKVVAGGAPCAGTLDDARLVEGDGLEMSFLFRCPPAPEAEVTLDFLDRLALGHRHLVSIPEAPAAGAPFAYREMKTFAVPAIAVRKTVPAWEWLRLAREGARASILALVLLASLLAAGGPRREVARTAGAFVASLYVASILSAHGVAPAARFLVPGMGLALLYAGLENFVASEGVRGRWPVAVPLGAMAGFSLAEAVHDVAMPVRERPLAGGPFGAGAAFAATLLGIACVLAVPRLSRVAAWARGAPSVAGALALAAGAWSLVRAWA